MGTMSKKMPHSARKNIQIKVAGLTDCECYEDVVALFSSFGVSIPQPAYAQNLQQIDPIMLTLSRTISDISARIGEVPAKDLPSVLANYCKLADKWELLDAQRVTGVTEELLEALSSPDVGVDIPPDIAARARIAIGGSALRPGADISDDSVDDATS